MKELIPLVNKLQDLSTKIGESLQLDLPQIVVVGGQSAGKSSVLENFVGCDFLPRGTGIVTRRPLILQLIHKKNDITILNLTLVDLPGLTKVPLLDQPVDIEYQIESMILKYINNKNTLILAVTPANTDLANSDALKLANKVDPAGIRTIGVITKLDLMDEGTDARDILENKLIPLKRGYVGVVNRSQKKIDENMNINDSITAEKEYFENHHAYRDMANKLGTPYLQYILNQQLETHIYNTLPEFRDKLLIHQQKLENDLEKYNEYVIIDESSDKTRVLLQILKQVRVEFDNAVGNFEHHELSKTPNIGCKIFKILHSKFPSDFSKITYNSPSTSEIDLAIQNIRGVRVGVWTPDSALRSFITKQFDGFKRPCFICVHKVVKEINNGFHSYTRNLSHFPKLQEQVFKIINSHIYEREKMCKKMLNDFIDIESSYINTNNDDYKILLNRKIRNTRVLNENDKLKIRVDAYLEHANKIIKDYVPKVIVHTIIDDCKNFIDTELPNCILKDEDWFLLIEFSQDKKQEYDELSSINDACKEALELIGNRVPVETTTEFKSPLQTPPIIKITLWETIIKKIIWLKNSFNLNCFK